MLHIYIYIYIYNIMTCTHVHTLHNIKYLCTCAYIQVAQTAVAAAAKRRAAFSTAKHAGMFQDAGSDSAGSTSTKASSGTPAKPKGKKLDTELEATGKTPPPGKRVRAKMTPLPSAEKTPSTSTPLPKALKDATATPGRATPGKMHIEELASPDVLAKKTLEFDELEGAPQ